MSSTAVFGGVGSSSGDAMFSSSHLVMKEAAIPALVKTMSSVLLGWNATADLKPAFCDSKDVTSVFKN